MREFRRLTSATNFLAWEQDKIKSRGCIFHLLFEKEMILERTRFIDALTDSFQNLLSKILGCCCPMSYILV